MVTEGRSPSLKADNLNHVAVDSWVEHNPAPDYQRAPWQLGGPLMRRGPLMLRGPMIFMGPLTAGRAPNMQKDHWWWLRLWLGPLIVTGAVTGTGACFSGGPRWSEGPRLPWRTFLSVSAQISWLLWGFRLLPPEFSAENPKGASLSPPLATSLIKSPP